MASSISSKSATASQSAKPSKSDKPSKSAIKRLTTLYIASLGAIAGLSLLGQLLIQRSLNQQTLDIQLVSTAQQQQILGQQLVRAALSFQLAQEPSDRRAKLLELQDAARQVEAGRQTWAALSASQQFSTDRQQQINLMTETMGPHRQRMLDAVREIAATRSETISQQFPRLNADQTAEAIAARPLATLMQTEQSFVRDIDRQVLEYNQRVADGVQRLRVLELGLFGITLTVLLLEGVLVFRPAVRQAQMALTALAKSLQETQTTAEKLAVEQQKSENLLLNILPQPIAQRLKQKQQAIADGFAEVTVLFADIVGFTKLSTTMPPQKLVSLLNEIFSAFDQLAERHGLEKIKTIGDAYMVVGGLPNPRADHAEAIVAMALDMQKAIAQFNAKTGESFSIRIGVNTGPVVAGVIGIKKFIYDLWGDTVNTASRMESHGMPDCIHITDSTYQCIKNKYAVKSLGTTMIKGKGEMETYMVTALLAKSSSQ